MRSVLAATLAAFLAQAPLSFEVASVKPNPSLDATESTTLEPGGGIRLTGFRLINLILGAYEMGAIQMRDQIIGGPSWIYSDRFDIVAKAEGQLTFDAEGRRPAEALAMLRTLLADRFAVKVHKETRTMNAFAISLARRDGKLGPALHASTAICPHYERGVLPPKTPAAEGWCGFRHVNGQVMARYVTMPEVASYFAAYAAIRRPTEDRTRLTGRYDFQVEFAEGADADPGSLFTAFREQLGLKFDSVRTQVPVLVIDHAERPTPD